MKRLFLMTCAAFICNFMNAQILVNQVATATYDYNSLYQSSDLHFYLYGDGYYSFDADNVHQFTADANGNTVKAYHSEPYDIDQIDQLVLNTVFDGITNATIPNYTLPNKVALQRSWSLVKDEDNFFILTFENKESSEPISGCIEFHYSQKDSDIDPLSILDDYNSTWVDSNEDHLTSEYQGYTHKFVWTFENLERNEQRHIYIPAGCFADAFDIVNTRAVMKVNNCETTFPPPGDNDGANPLIFDAPIYTLRSQVRNFPHDPNGIVTDPNCLSPKDEFHTIRYKIYFQNDGVDPVDDVRLDFIVHTPFHTIELIASSHTSEMVWHPQANELDYSEAIEFNFYDIYLLGSGAMDPPEYDETYGWVTFDICFNLKAFSILGLQCAPSEVDIYFAPQLPVSATNEICRNCQFEAFEPAQQSYYDCPDLLPATQETGASGNKVTSTEYIVDDLKSELQISPNPTHDLLFINTHDFDKSDVIKIRNMNGEVIQKLFVKDIDQSLNLADIPAGVYYISVQNEASVKTKAFVKL